MALAYRILVLLYYCFHTLRIKQRARFGNPFGLQISLIFWGLFCNGPFAVQGRRLRMQKGAAAGTYAQQQRLWRSGWDSNPRDVSIKLISSQGRYNHFDTAPYINFDSRPSIFGETFRREPVPSAPSINPGAIDFTGFFACELLRGADDFESFSSIGVHWNVPECRGSYNR